ncbi:MAG: CoA transferase [Deltaproteobacteria bacterium]|jgi:formyl-CoA transferase|nr:CoA transferase [Deltaproteobacteria bacterium]
MALLKGIRVLETATVIAAPFCATMLADFGADVIKIEMPGGGDPFRRLGPYHKGRAMRWAALGRNKRCVTLDLRKEVGKEMFLRLAAQSDVLIENFRTGTMDKWGLDRETLLAANPKLVITRLTGYGQTGPNAGKAGFGTPATAYSGMTYLTGFKDRPPVSPSFSLTDYVSGLFALSGVMMALYNRDAKQGKPDEIDVSLYEGIFRMLEVPVMDLDKNGVLRERTPRLSGTSSPGGTYETQDGKWVVLVCSTDKTWEYLANAMGRADLLTDPLYENMAARLRNDASLDALVRAWVGSMGYDELQAIVDAAGVPTNLVNSMADIFADPHYAARENILDVPHPEFGSIKMPGIVPRFVHNPGAVKWSGPELGQHNAEVYGELLGLDAARLVELKEQGVI